MARAALGVLSWEVPLAPLLRPSAPCRITSLPSCPPAPCPFLPSCPSRSRPLDPLAVSRALVQGGIVEDGAEMVLAQTVFCQATRGEQAAASAALARLLRCAVGGGPGGRGRGAGRLRWRWPAGG